MKMNTSHSVQDTTCRKVSRKNHVCLDNACLSVVFLPWLLFLCSHVTASTPDYDDVSLPFGEVVTSDFPFPDSPASLPFSGVLTIQPYYVHVGTVSPHETEEIPNNIQTLWATQLAKANDVFKQIGIQIESRNTLCISEIQVDGIGSGVFDDNKENAHLKDYYEAKVGRTGGWIGPSNLEIAPVFIVKSFNSPDTTGQTVTTWLADHLVAEGLQVFDTDQSGCFIAYGHTINWDTLAHELGHLLLNDRFFYNSASDEDDTRHHLSARDHLMSKYRTASIIDFEPVVKDVYANPRFPNQKEYDSIENIRNSRMNHIEAMYDRTPYILKEDFTDFGPTYLNILMPSFYETPEGGEDPSEVLIGIQSENEGVFGSLSAIVLWGGKQQTWRLCEFWSLSDVVEIAKIKISGWARLVPESNPEDVEYCIDLYFSEPFYYNRYQSHSMVPDEFGNEPYFGLLCSAIGRIQSSPHDVSVFVYRELVGDDSISRIADIGAQEIPPTFVNTNSFPSFLSVILRLSDVQGISQLRCIYRMPKVVPPGWIPP